MSNVLISSRAEAKIVDFGLASMDEAVKDDVRTNTRTIDYVALERASGARKDDTRSDIYFLGCIYYNLLTGRPPLSETRDPVQRLHKQRFLEVVPVQNTDPSLPPCVTAAVNKAMMLDPEHRYQTPAAMLSELRMVQRRLAEERPEQDGAASATPADLPRKVASAADAPDTGRSVMVVESDGNVQDVFREGFRRAGYRVLVTADPVRAVNRFRQDAVVADCVIFNAQQIGQPALEMFNVLGDGKETESVPALLLLDEVQQKWKLHAHTARHRIVLVMPVTMKQLRTIVAHLAPPKTQVASGGT
jgi:CheY-like chemotaxis protein